MALLNRSIKGLAQIGLFVALMSGNSLQAKLNMAGLFDFQYKNGQQSAAHNSTVNHGGSNTFTVGQMTLFLDGDVTRDMFFSGEVQSDLLNPAAANTDFYIRNASVTVTNIKKWQTNMQFGRFNTVFGSFVDRRLSLDNPLFDSPLAYTHKVNLDPDAGWVTPDFNITTGLDTRALSMVDRRLSQTGVKIFANILGTKLNYALSLTNNPVSNPQSVNTNNGVAVGMKLHWIADHASSFGFSFSQGGYLNSVNKLDPANAARNVDLGNPVNGNTLNTSRYMHTVFGFHYNWEKERYKIYTEYINSAFEVPNNPTANELSSEAFYVEGKYNFTKNFFGAARFDSLNFDNTVYAPLAVGAAQKWDDDLSRIEVGIGNWVNPFTLAKFTYQSTDFDIPGNVKDFDMVVGSVSVVF